MNKEIQYEADLAARNKSLAAYAASRNAQEPPHLSLIQRWELDDPMFLKVCR